MMIACAVEMEDVKIRDVDADSSCGKDGEHVLWMGNVNENFKRQGDGYAQSSHVVEAKALASASAAVAADAIQTLTAHKLQPTDTGRYLDRLDDLLTSNEGQLREAAALLHGCGNIYAFVL
jgi:hypothetical protein